MNSSYNTMSKNKPVKTQAEDLNRHFSKEVIYTDDQQAHENMLNTDNFSRSANQNHNEITLHLSEWLSSKYIQITNGKDVGENALLFTVGTM